MQDSNIIRDQADNIIKDKFLAVKQVKFIVKATSAGYGTRKISLNSLYILLQSINQITTLIWLYCDPRVRTLLKLLIFVSDH